MIFSMVFQRVVSFFVTMETFVVVDSAGTISVSIIIYEKAMRIEGI